MGCQEGEFLGGLVEKGEGIFVVEVGNENRDGDDDDNDDESVGFHIFFQPPGLLLCHPSFVSRLECLQLDLG